MIELYRMPCNSVNTELDFVMLWLSSLEIQQYKIARLGKIVTQKGKSIYPKSAYISKARNSVKDGYNIEILNFIKSKFRIDCEEKDNEYFITCNNRNEFDDNLIQLREILDNSEANDDRSVSQIIAKSRFFENTEWNLYTRNRTNRGIEKHRLALNAGGHISIFNAEPRKDYIGTWKFESYSYLVLTLHHHKTNDKSLHMLFYVGRGENPELCLGVFINSGDTGGRTYAGTCILTINLSEKEIVPETFDWHTLELEGQGNEIPNIISKYLRDKELNQISTPGRGIRTLDDLKDWWTKKNSFAIDAKLPSYIGIYKVFYYDDGDLVKLELDIHQDEFNIMGEINNIEKDREFGIGIVTRYERTLFLMVRSTERPVYLQMDIGGSYTSDYECYRGLISGLTYTEEELVTYPIIVVKSNLLDKPDINMKFRKKLEENFNNGNMNGVFIKSPKRFKIDNL